MLHIFNILWLCTLLVACAHPANKLEDIQPVGFIRKAVATPKWAIATWARTDGIAPYHIYIEGDGRAWASRTRPSKNPTPRTPVALHLALADPHPSVLYIARPCQYTDIAQQPDCTPYYWTDGRFAPEVIDAIRQAITAYTTHPYHLIGYSGGGAIAALIAAETPQTILSLRTVAGNLDHAFLSRHHRVSPLEHSLNPYARAGRLGQVPQLHFSGERDRIVPPETAHRFVAATHGPCARQIVAESDHNDAWAALWPKLLSIPLPCPRAGL